MNTKNLTQEQISAFADGEADSQSEIVMAALRHPESRADWDLYHQIGDVLRSEEMGFSMSAGFETRMAARLELEPTIVAPPAQQAGDNSAGVSNVTQLTATAASNKRRWNPFAMAGIAAAAAVAFIVGPQMVVAIKGGAAELGTPATVAARSTTASPLMTEVQVPTTNLPAERAEVVAVGVQEGVILRDPRIDEYLLAHQRYSPSVYSTAQYARSAAFATEANK